jgi:hypothetical protein
MMQDAVLSKRLAKYQGKAGWAFLSFSTTDWTAAWKSLGTTIRFNNRCRVSVVRQGALISDIFSDSAERETILLASTAGACRGPKKKQLHMKYWQAKASRGHQKEAQLGAGTGQKATTRAQRRCST